MDLHWRLATKQLNESELRDAGQGVAASYEGVRVEVEKEDPEFITLFFDVPWDEGSVDAALVEITVYDLGRDGIVMSLEADAADNDAAFDDAAQIAEDLADRLGGHSIEV
jgi:hypothetical protein